MRLAITRMARRLRQQAGAEEEASPTLISALATVAREGPLSPSALADSERIQRPTATRVLGRLEQKGLVSRTPDPDDGRVSRVAVTPEGTALLKRIRSLKNQYLSKRLETLTPDERETLAAAAEILERLLDDGRRP